MVIIEAVIRMRGTMEGPAGAKGFTLVEALVGMVIFALVLMLATLLLVRGYAGYAAAARRVDVQESMRIALDQMSAHIRSARASSLGIAPGGRKLTFQNGRSENDGYRYDAVDREIEELIGSVWLPVASNVDSLSFEVDAASSVVTIRVSGGDRGWPPSQALVLTTRVYTGVQ